VVNDQLEHLRVLIADERRDRRASRARVVVGLGHEVIAGEIDAAGLPAMTAGRGPDVTLVELGRGSRRALALVEEIAKLSSCPVIALSADNRAAMREAARRGAFACLVEDSPAGIQSAIDVAVLRFAEYRNLQEAFARRAVIEQAKGILMSRNEINSNAAFAMLRDHSRHKGLSLVAVAVAIVDSHLLLPQEHAK